MSLGRGQGGSVQNRLASFNNSAPTPTPTPRTAVGPTPRTSAFGSSPSNASPSGSSPMNKTPVSVPQQGSPTPSVHKSPSFEAAQATEVPGSPQRTPRSRPARFPMTTGATSPGTAPKEIPINDDSHSTPQPAPPPQSSKPSQAPAPAPAATEVTVCDRCDELPSSKACEQCKKNYCGECSAEVHSVGKWATHTLKPIGSSPSLSPAAATPAPQQVQPVASPAPVPVKATSPPPVAAANHTTNNTTSSPGAKTASGSFLKAAPTQGVTSPVQTPVNANATATVNRHGTFSKPAPPSGSHQLTREVNPVPVQPKQPVVYTPINKNPVIDFSQESKNLPGIKEQMMDSVIDTLMGVSLSYLTDGVFMRDTQNQSILFIRLSEEQSHLEYAEVEDVTSFDKTLPLDNPERINIVDIVDLKEEGASSFSLHLKSNSSLSLELETRNQFIFVFDGLRCLIGMTMQTSEMQAALSALTEVEALTTLYNAPPIPEPPSNFNFVSAF